MHRSVLCAAALTILSLGAGSAATAQATTTGGFTLGYMDIGPTIGLGGIGSAGVAFGGRIEKGIKALPDMGDGMLGIEASIDIYSYDYVVGHSFRYIPIGVTANYHFNVKSNRKIDPFLGLGLGYLTVSTSFGGTYGNGSGIYFIGRAGVRYFMKERLALYADAGAGAATLNAGVTFGIGGGK
ncbi:MAG: outer membrane beta-barrel protein [Gemmatimonadaceae bacterium]